MSVNVRSGPPRDTPTARDRLAPQRGRAGVAREGPRSAKEGRGPMGGRSRWSVALAATLLCLWLPLLHSASDPSVRPPRQSRPDRRRDVVAAAVARDIATPPTRRRRAAASPRAFARAQLRADPSHAASAHDRRNRSRSRRPPPCARSSRCARGRPPRAPRARLFLPRGRGRTTPRAQSSPDPVRRRTPPGDPPPRSLTTPSPRPASRRSQMEEGSPIGARRGQGAVAEGARQSLGKRGAPRARSEALDESLQRGGADDPGSRARTGPLGVSIHPLEVNFGSKPSGRCPRRRWWCLTRTRPSRSGSWSVTTDSLSFQPGSQPETLPPFDIPPGAGGRSR